MSDEGLKLVITRRGLDAAISAKNKGIKATLKWVSVGDAAYIPNKEQLVLQNERARVEFGEYKDTGGSSIQAAAKFSGSDEYSIREIGFWLDDGTLFGVISKPDTTLNYKAKDAHCIQPFTLNISDLPSDSITVIVGTENLNIMIDEEFETLSTAVIEAHCLLLDHTFQLHELDKNVESLKENQQAFEESAQSHFERQHQSIKQNETKLSETNQTQNEVVNELATSLVESFHLNLKQELRLSDLERQVRK